MKSLFLTTLLSLLLLAGLGFGQSDGFNVAAGKSYTITPAPSEGYPDPESDKLTDGQANFAWSDMVGFEGVTGPITIVVDLGEIHDEITYAALKVMRSDGSDVLLPQSSIVSVSEDGILYEDLGMATTYLEGEVGNDTVGTLVWADPGLPGYGRYVRFEVRPSGEAWTMIAEAIVGAGEIPEDQLPPVATTEAADLGPAEIITLGRPYTLTPTPSQAYPDDGDVQVTDGSYEYAWGDMIGFDTPPENPTVVIDLGERVEGITRVSGHFMRSFASSVNFPNSMIISVSDDGETFRDVGLATFTDPEPIENELINELYWESTASPIAGRYLMVEIRPRGEAWTMLAEITARTGAE